MTRQDRSDGPRRLDSLDGLRGLAALSVVLYHFTLRWAEPNWPETLFPFGDVFQDRVPYLNGLGSYGVRLFFVTSGFVILMTLERSTGLVDFTVRRMARLWPAMIVCATLSTLIINGIGTYSHFDSTRGFEVTWLEYLSSLVFIDPSLIGTLVGAPDADWVEGVYWTLWAEVRFYAVIALLWWAAGARHFLAAWILLQTLSLLAALGLIGTTASWSLNQIITLPLQPAMLGYFTFGLLAYRLWTGRAGWPDALLAGLASAGILAGQVDQRILPDLLVLASFGLVLIPGPWHRVLSWRPLLLVGLASYPLYLFHERVGLIALVELGQRGVPSLISVPVTLGALLAIAVAIYHGVERPARRVIRNRLQPGCTRLQRRFTWLGFRRGTPPSPGPGDGPSMTR